MVSINETDKTVYTFIDKILWEHEKFSKHEELFSTIDDAAKLLKEMHFPIDHTEVYGDRVIFCSRESQFMTIKWKLGESEYSVNFQVSLRSKVEKIKDGDEVFTVESDPIPIVAFLRALKREGFSPPLRKWVNDTEICVFTYKKINNVFLEIKICYSLSSKNK